MVALNAHGDVVPPGAGWTGSPYGGEVRDGWLYGRGAAVSKSDFTTYAFALRALKQLRASGAALAGTVELHLTYDEETGGMTGPGWILSQGLSRPDYVISAAFSHHVVVAHNGCLHLEVDRCAAGRRTRRGPTPAPTRSRPRRPCCPRCTAIATAWPSGLRRPRASRTRRWSSA